MVFQKGRLTHSRLTLVAFIFIPLNFATSFFGMNVEQLGTGSMNIGYFFLAATLIGGFAALLSFLVKPLEHRLQRRRREIADQLGEDVGVIQKREILRQSKLGRRLCTRSGDVEPDRYAPDELIPPGPKIRKALRRLVTDNWKNLTTAVLRVEMAIRAQFWGNQRDIQRRSSSDS